MRAPVYALVALCAQTSSALRPAAPLSPRRAVRAAALPDDDADGAGDFEKLDALGERLRRRRAANDFLSVATNDAIITEAEADAARDKIDNPDPEAPPPEPKERYSRFGDWFDVLAK